jgi:hypothetical protein
MLAFRKAAVDGDIQATEPYTILQNRAVLMNIEFFYSHSPMHPYKRRNFVGSSLFDASKALTAASSRQQYA